MLQGKRDTTRDISCSISEIWITFLKLYEFSIFENTTADKLRTKHFFKENIIMMNTQLLYCTINSIILFAGPVDRRLHPVQGSGQLWTLPVVY